MLQASHLSFQEFSAARALCEEGTRLAGAPPWQWPAWWANAVRLGAETGAASGFGGGLLRAAGVAGDALELAGQLGGDRPTVLAMLVAVLKLGAPAGGKCRLPCLRPIGLPGPSEGTGRSSSRGWSTCHRQARSRTST